MNGVDVDVSSPSHRGEVLSLSSTDAPDFLTIDENIRLLWKDIKYSVPVGSSLSLLMLSLSLSLSRLFLFLSFFLPVFVLSDVPLPLLGP